ncbi:MAG: methyltransferase domain-containing protein [Mobilicoccus sp.]|nr:methyltransferase domain-containing protein [Mobilicoccus sp.]
MLVFGVSVESTERFDRHCLPAIAAHGGADATLMSATDGPPARTYNEVLAASLDLEDVEAVVLLRDDVEIVDPHFRARIRAAFERDPQLALIGVSGADSSLRWWQTTGRPTHGQSTGAPDLGTLVDYIDGACMVVRPDLAARLRFDDQSFTGATGFEVDFCHRLRELGMRITVEPLGVVRHAAPDDVDAAYREAAAVWQGRRARSVGLDALEHHVARADGTHESPHRFGSVPPSQARPEEDLAGRHRRALDALPRTAGRILQLGCGDGTFARRLATERGAVVTGLDHEGGHLEQARGHLHDVVAADLNRLPELDYPRGHFDAIVAVDILDRLVDPEATLAELLPYLASDGVVVAGIPNVKHWSVVLPLLLQDRFEYRDAGILHRGSIRLFTMVEAVALFRRLGLSRFEVCGSEQIPLHDPAHLDALVSCIASYGSDPDEARTMLEAYEFVVAARRA